MGLSLYVVIGFSDASSEIAPESIFFHYTTLGIHSTTEIPAPTVQSATRGSPPLFGDPCFLSNACSNVDISHDRVYAATADCGQPR